jgi:hypothetical protein
MNEPFYGRTRVSSPPLQKMVDPIEDALIVHGRPRLNYPFSPVRARVISAQNGQKRRLICPRSITSRGSGVGQTFSTYTFTSPFSFNSDAENGFFFFWLLWVLPSCGGVV